MKPQRTIEYLTGFIMGLFLGLGLDGIFIIFIRLINRLSEAEIKFAWWWLLPLPVLSGLFMSKAIADLHLEDY
ncbi:MAG: hypothetical protein H0S79_26025 [Anaerolineaceae bacterium]|nr:hypothetical protein [Anaerolineaceae bacterium]